MHTCYPINSNIHLKAIDYCYFFKSKNRLKIYVMMSENKCLHKACLRVPRIDLDYMKVLLVQAWKPVTNINDNLPHWLVYFKYNM